MEMGGILRNTLIPMHNVTEFGEIRTKFVRISYELTRFP